MIDSLNKIIIEFNKNNLSEYGKSYLIELLLEFINNLKQNIYINSEIEPFNQETYISVYNLKDLWGIKLK